MVNPFSKGTEFEIYGSTTRTANDHHHLTEQRKSNFNQRPPLAPVNSVSPATNSAVQFQPTAITTSFQATLNMNLWLQQNNPGLLARFSEPSNTRSGLACTNTSPRTHVSAAKALSPISMPNPQEHATAENLLPKLPSINQDYARITENLKHWNLELTDQLNSANQQLRSSQDTISSLKYRLIEQERAQTHHNHRSAAVRPERSYVITPKFIRPVMSSTTRPEEPVTPSPTKELSLMKAFDSPSTPTKPQPPPAPQHPPTRSFRRRHHRTATPEQRSIRAMMGNKPVFTVGMGPQNDRCLLFDFFEHIKQWAAAYTVHIKSLNAEQVHNLSAHLALAGSLGKPSQLMVLVTEQDMLIAMVASVVCRHMWTYALDEHSIYASGHPQADICEELAWKWTTIPLDNHEAKHDLLLAQQEIYTAIKNAPDHKTWRAACAERLTTKLLSDLNGLLATSLFPAALTDRNHTLSELYVKGYRIGFRLRMAATKWQFQWPSPGAEFNPGTMVNESRMLYGNVLRTMGEVMKDPRAHEVLFAVSPTVTRSEFSAGHEQRAVVHNALVHITHKGYA
ncbi:uncharacterized protein K460DRAFT_408511 [Cucurbitaria berberidis CBS 394.84]|uniref:Uncharacterized protein n=1 Tax=Cucurbitaria berberidis CBS 394.84 TaxID=1168544 RepID=A0A9P4GFA9_9PLEO|nr:uncharacterized protein K460DRAFT_408511 [Cucurbitaria berberidis CBS 394.84]KAF1844211.1 hypothetical protein K460DRAFT_408511 [Cucurbitaria berberidis CBS 394.84]